MARWRVSPELAASLVSSMILHAGWLLSEAKASSAPEPKAAEMVIETETLPPPPPPPPPQVEPTPPATVDARPQPRAANAPARDPVAAPPPAALAGKTLTAPEPEDDSSVADFTMVQGSGQTYAGGTTTALGTSATAVRGPAGDRPAATSRPVVTVPIASVAAGPDRSRGATPAYSDWDCSHLFPGDAEAGDRAKVVIAVTVLPNGSPKTVAVLSDPGHGFGAAARTCAMGQRYRSALDREGNPILATTPPITVRFTR